MKRKRHAAMVVFSYYLRDPRVKREAEAYIDNDMDIDVICLRDAAEKKNETVNGVSIFRINVERKRQGKFRYIWEYTSFILLSFFKLTFLYFRHRYKIIHIHNMPDILVFTALIPRLFGSKIILDLHDPMPEVYMTKYDMDRSNMIIKFIVFCERLSISFSNFVITPNIAFRNLFISRGCNHTKIDVIMNTPDESIFYSDDDFQELQIQKSEYFILMYHGTIVERHGLDTALEAIHLLKDKIPKIIFNVYGSGDSFVSQFQTQIKNYKLEDTVFYHGQVTLNKIAELIKTINLGIIPNKKSVFTELNLPTRIFEYLSIHKPVIAPNTVGIRDYFSNKDLYFFKSGDAKSLAKSILDVYDSLLINDYKILKNGISVYRRHRWKKEKQKLLKTINMIDKY